MPKINPKHYASAFLDVLKEGLSEGGALQGLFQTLRARGDLGRRLEILTAVEREAVQRSGGRLVRAEFAHALGISERKEFLESWGKNDRVAMSVSPELVAGLKILIDGETELDLSLHAKLD